MFVTVGHEGILRCWSICKHQCYPSLKLNNDDNRMMLGPVTRTKRSGNALAYSEFISKREEVSHKQ